MFASVCSGSFFGGGIRAGDGAFIANVRNVNCVLLVRTFCIHVQNFHELRSAGTSKESKERKTSKRERERETERRRRARSRVGSAA